MNNCRNHKLVELINSAETISELDSMCKTLDMYIPIKYRMLQDVKQINNKEVDV